MNSITQKSQDLKIWSHYINAQSKLLDRLCAPIPLLPAQEKISSTGILRVEIDQSKEEKDIKEVIQRHFPKVKDKDVFIEEDFFLVDNDTIL